MRKEAFGGDFFRAIIRVQFRLDDERDGFIRV